MADAATFNVTTNQQNAKKRTKNKKKLQTQTIKIAQIDNMECEAVSNGIEQHTMIRKQTPNGKSATVAVTNDKCLNELLEELQITASPTSINGDFSLTLKHNNDTAYKCQNGHDNVVSELQLLSNDNTKLQLKNFSKATNIVVNSNNNKEKQQLIQQQHQIVSETKSKVKNKIKQKDAAQSKQKQQQEHCHTTTIVTTEAAAAAEAATSNNNISSKQQNSIIACTHTDAYKPIENGNDAHVLDQIPIQNQNQNQKKAKKQQKPIMSTAATQIITAKTTAPVVCETKKSTAKSKKATTPSSSSSSTTITETNNATTCATITTNTIANVALDNAANATTTDFISKLRPNDMQIPYNAMESLSFDETNSDISVTARNTLAQIEFYDTEPSTSAAAAAAEAVRNALKAQKDYDEQKQNRQIQQTEQVGNICMTKNMTDDNINNNNDNNHNNNNNDPKIKTTHTVNIEKKIITNAINNGDSSETSSLDINNVHIEYTEYEDEHQMHDIMRLIQAELSEPYSIYTYRYFIYNWPKLCFLARHGNEYVGAIVCKLDMHLNLRRGYIAMLAVRKEYRKLKIGTTLVTKAIEAMLADNADEVVLETEMRNLPALRLYENLGFVRDKRLFRYYLNGVDALRLKLWFR